MHKIIIYILSLSIPAVAAAQVMPQQLDKLVDSLGGDIIHNVNAVGLSVGVYHSGETKFYNFGSIDKTTNQKPTQSSVYEIGSITKTFVSLLLAHAVLDKKINLRDDIRKYLPQHYPNLACNSQPIR